MPLKNRGIFTPLKRQKRLLKNTIDALSYQITPRKIGKCNPKCNPKLRKNVTLNCNPKCNPKPKNTHFLPQKQGSASLPQWLPVGHGSATAPLSSMPSYHDGP